VVVRTRTRARREGSVLAVEDVGGVDDIDLVSPGRGDMP
jgi:hypothetical protein